MAINATNYPTAADTTQYSTESNKSTKQTSVNVADDLRPDARQLANTKLSDGSILTDPRQAAEGLSNNQLPGTEIPTGDDGLLADGRQPIGTEGGVKTGPNDQRNHDPLGGAFSMEEKFGNAVGSRIGERAAGGGAPQDPNAQGGDPGEFVGMLAIAALTTSNPAGWVALAGTFAVGMANYVYDATIADGERVKPEVTDNGADTPEGVTTDEETEDAEETQGGTSGGGDVSEEDEDASDVQYVMENSTPTPDDTSGDNPNPAPTPDINIGGPTTNPKDTVSQPVGPDEAEVDPSQLKARVEELSTGLSNRNQWAINTGDHGDGVGGTQPEDVDTSVLPDEDPVGDPGSPTGNPSDPA